MKRNLFFCMFGVLLLGFGSAICRIGQAGLDPCTSMNAGIAQGLHSTLGITMMTFQVILLSAVFILDKNYIGWGTFINALCLGYCIDGFTALLRQYFFAGDTRNYNAYIMYDFWNCIYYAGGIFIFYRKSWIVTIRCCRQDF